MSGLTKILIVLLTLSSFFLCGIVVTYVANADNYRQQSKDLKVKLDASSEKEKSAKKQLEERKKKYQQQETRLEKEIASLKVEIDQLQGDLNNVEREKAQLLQEASTWKAITKDFYTTTDKQGQLLKNALKELDRVRTEQIKERKELNDTTAVLIEKMAIVETLKVEKRRLLEKKTELQNRLDQFLMPMGEEAGAAVPATLERTTVQPAQPAAKEIGLQGLVTKVDLKNSMAEISIGKADGIKEGMRFHVSRGNEFICDILIIDVQDEDAVGILELMVQQPKVGDNVSTNL